MKIVVQVQNTPKWFIQFDTPTTVTCRSDVDVPFAKEDCRKDTMVSMEK